jgi:uncharacterized membrane-anchored protein YhcB (DUF1043 family)
MSYLFAHVWPYALAALVIGAVTGWIAVEQTRNQVR